MLCVFTMYGIQYTVHNKYIVHRIMNNYFNYLII